MSTGDIEITSVPDGLDAGTGDERFPGTELSTHLAVRGVAKASPLSPRTQQSLLKSVIRKRWWLLAICAVVSGCVAAFVARIFQTETIQVEGMLLYKELPAMTRTKVYSGQPVETHAQLLESPTYLNTVIEKRSLQNEVDVVGFQRSLKVTADGRAKTITVNLTWTNVEDGTAILNDLMEMYIDRTVQERRTTATEYIRHAEQQLFRAESVESNYQKMLRDFNQKQGLTPYEQQQIPETLKQYGAALGQAEIALTGSKIRMASLNATRAESMNDFKKKILDAKAAKFKRDAEKYDRGGQTYAQLQKLLSELSALGDKSAEYGDHAKWKEAVDAVGRTTHAWANQYGSRELEDAALKLDHLSEEHAKTEIDVKIYSDSIRDLNVKTDETKKKLETVNNSLRPQTEERRDLEEQLAGAAAYKRDVYLQLSALKEVAASPVKEFTIAAQASWVYGSVTSTYKKLFAAAFFAAALVLAAPVFGCEYYLNRESPADETARRFGLPLLSRGALSKQITRKKTGELAVAKKAGEDEDDSVRLLALRIQQSLRRPGAVIVFSALEHEESPVSLICKLAACFAEREELVLVVDASGTLEKNRAILASLFQGTPHRTSDGKPLDPTITDPDSSESHMATFGVSDFLCHEELELSDLMLPTKYPRVDTIHGGVCSPPREGLASRRMSELLEQSRGRYTMILVASPSTKHQTDVQLLAARADGMLFTVAPNSPISSRGHEVIQDLIDLDAPVMGLIG